MIKKVSSSQFAGVTDRKTELTDGLNIIYGKNESGKSTFVNLISDTLFRNAKLNRKKDTDFHQNRFPCSLRNGNQPGDFIDGEIVIEKNGEAYTLSKIWSFEDSSCKLITPDGAIRSQDRIDEKMKELLVYGEGVYSELLFSPQANIAPSLRMILNSAKSTGERQEIVSELSLAFAQSGGISADDIGQAIEEKINIISGSRWDTEKGVPVKKTGSARWTNGLGEITKAYYSYEDALNTLRELEGLEKSAGLSSADYESAERDYLNAQSAYNNLKKYEEAIKIRSLLESEIKKLEMDCNEYKSALENWPLFRNKAKTARRLRDERDNSEILHKYQAVKTISDSIKKLKEITDEASCPTAGEISDVKSLLGRISSLEAMLCGINISAAIKLSEGNTINVTSLLTGEPVDIRNGLCNITEAVHIEIPNVMEMNLAPADVQVEEVEESVHTCKADILKTLEKYSAADIAELEELALKAAEYKKELQFAEKALSNELNGDSYDELKKRAEAIADPVRSRDEIYNAVRELCGEKNIDKYIAQAEAQVDFYCGKYGTEDALADIHRRESLTLEEKSARLSATEEIPCEYKSIPDISARLEVLQENIKTAHDRRDAARDAKKEAEVTLVSFRDNLPDNPKELAEQSRRMLNEKKEELEHWLHIRQVFNEQRQLIRSNPMHGLAEGFAANLSAISDNRVSSEFPDEEKLDMKIYSGNRIVSFDTLSEGTKETVSLAFRLAVLDHLFPEGGGIIVLDDPLSDMDKERYERSCLLIKEYAERHQIIFLTCREEYLDMLDGNVIEF